MEALLGIVVIDIPARIESTILPENVLYITG